MRIIITFVVVAILVMFYWLTFETEFDDSGWNKVRAIATVASAMGTAIVCFLAIWGDWLKARLFPPLVEIKLENPQGSLEKLGQRPLEIVFYHLVVENKRPTSPAKNCQVRLVLKQARV